MIGSSFWHHLWINKNRPNRPGLHYREHLTEERQILMERPFAKFAFVFSVGAIDVECGLWQEMCEIWTVELGGVFLFCRCEKVAQLTGCE